MLKRVMTFVLMLIVAIIFSGCFGASLSIGDTNSNRYHRRYYPAYYPVEYYPVPPAGYYP